MLNYLLKIASSSCESAQFGLTRQLSIFIFMLPQNAFFKENKWPGLFFEAQLVIYLNINYKP